MMRYSAIVVIVVAAALAPGCKQSQPNDQTPDDNPSTLVSCGDGIVEDSESCDGTNLGNASCVSQGFFAGRLSCTSSCAIDTSGCQPFGSASYAGFIQAYCGFLMRCAATLGKSVPDQATCEARVQAGFCDGVPPASQTAVDGCASYFTSTDCSWDPSNLFGTLPASCIETLIGVTPAQLGEPCVGLCAAGLDCNMTLVGNQLCGTCEPYPQLDAPCGLVGASYVSCDPTLYCDGDTYTCTNKQVDSTPCVGGEECLSDLCTGGTCTARPTSGSPCTPGDTCAKPFQTCVAGYCGDPLIDGSSCTRNEECMMESLCVGGVCTSYPACTPRAVGQGCQRTADCATGSYCPAGVCVAYLALDATCTSSTQCGPDAFCDRTPTPDACMALVPVGGSCAGGASCVHGAECDDGGDETCKAPRQIGESCLGGLICVPTAFCLAVSSEEATCTAKYGAGVNCTNGRECASDYCDDATGQCADTASCG